MFPGLFSTAFILAGLITAQTALDGRTFSFPTMTGPHALADQGYNPELIKSRIMLEAHSLVSRSQSRDQATDFAVSNADGPPEIIAKQLGLQPALDAAQNYVGRLSYSIVGSVVDRGSEYQLVLTSTRFDGRVVQATMHRPKTDVDLLIKDAGYALIHMVSPHLACASRLQEARYAMANAPFDGTRVMECIDKALPSSLDNEKVWLLNLQGITYALEGKRDAAFSSLKGALTIEPNFSPALVNVGIMFAMNGQPEQARKAYREVFKKRLSSDSAQTYSSAHALWGLSLEKLGNKKRALEHYWLAVRADPNFPIAQQILLDHLPPDSPDAQAIRNNLKYMDSAEGLGRVYTENLLGFIDFKTLE